MSEKPIPIVGIDLLSNDDGGGLYGLCESHDGGETWKVVHEGRSIDGLLEFAKLAYSESTQMILPQQIRELLKYEFLETRELKRLGYLQAKEEPPLMPPFLSWWERLLKRFLWR
jgi:hypothetical protein